MTQPESMRFKVAWISLAIIGGAILAFGLVITVYPASSNPLLQQANGIASIGMGLFGIMIASVPYRRRERWAWFTLWYYPIFWLAHLLGGLPPGRDHIHQLVFIILSLVSQLLSVNEFFRSRTK